MPALASTEPLPLEAMTSSQLIRRARLLEATLELAKEVGGQALQMKDIAARASVALGTVYRYFASKEHLLATAFADWKDRSARRLATTTRTTDLTTAQVVSTYLVRELRSLYRHPHLAVLMTQLIGSNDPYVRQALEQMSETEAQVLRNLMPDLESELVQSVIITLGALLSFAVNRVATRTANYETAADALERGTLLVLEGALKLSDSERNSQLEDSSR